MRDKFPLIRKESNPFQIFILQRQKVIKKENVKKWGERYRSLAFNYLIYKKHNRDLLIVIIKKKKENGNRYSS